MQPSKCFFFRSSVYTTDLYCNYCQEIRDVTRDHQLRPGSRCKSEQNKKFISGEKNEKEIAVAGPWSRPQENTSLEQTEEITSNVSEFQTVLPQILAVSTINLILLDLGMILAFPTIIIPDLLKSTESLKFTEEQASWFGSVAFICQPLGSLLSGFLFDPVGRKKTMMYVNIPLLMAWLLIHFTKETEFLYVGAIIMGIGIGLMDAPHITYLGEITQPKWRGVLTSYAELCIALGFCFINFMGTTANWRTISAICSAVPFVTMLLITQIPESPMWLLSKGRKEEAERSLCWLRGWVKPDIIQKEFSELLRHSNANYGKRESCLFETLPPNHSGHSHKKISFGKRFLQKTGVECIFRRSILQPLLLVVIYFGFSHVAGVTSTRPFMVDIIKEFKAPVNAKWVTAISSVVGMAGFITGMILLPKTGKRLLSLISMFGCTVTCGLMAIYGFFFDFLNLPVILVFLFILLNFIWCAGIGQIPWMLISEVFPFKGRGLASGISAAISYVQAFIFTKTYYATYNSLTLFGVFGFYAVCTFLGGIFLYFYLPETEGKTLQEIESIIENHFNKFQKKEKTITDT